MKTWRVSWVARLSLLCLPILGACGDDSANGGDGDIETEAGISETDGGGGASSPSEDAGFASEGPAFSVAAPNSGDVLAARALVRIDTRNSSLAEVEVAVDGDLITSRGGATDSGLSFTLDVDDLPDGEVTLEFRGLDADGELLGSVDVDVTVIADPPMEDMIGPSGGALATESGVVVIVPPGAVEEPSGFRVADRALEDLPSAAFSGGYEVLGAIDFLPMEGDPDPEFRLERPAQILFPYESDEDPAACAAIGAGGSPVIGNLGPSGGDESGLQLVGGATVASGFAGTRTTFGPSVTGVSNLTSPGETLRPLDLLQLQGSRFPTRPGRLQARFDGGPTQDVSVAASGSSATVVIPPDVGGGTVELQLISRFNIPRVTLELEIDEADDELPSASVSDARIELLFDGMIAQLDEFESADFSDADNPRGEAVADLRQRFGEALGMPMQEWREILTSARDEFLAMSSDDRRQVGSVLKTLEDNLVALEMADIDTLNSSSPSDEIPGFRQSRYALTQAEACLTLQIMRMFLQYFDFVTGGFIPLPPILPQDIIKATLLKLAMFMVEATSDSVGCDDPDEDQDEDQGIWHYECDLLLSDTMLDDDDDDQFSGTVTGDVYGYGPRSPAGLGLGVGGQLPDDIFQSTMWPLAGAVVRLLDASTSDPASGFVTSQTNPNGSFQFTDVMTNVQLDVSVTLPDGSVFTFTVDGPAADEATYVPIFVPMPGEDGDSQTVADDFPFAFAGGDDIGFEVGPTNGGLNSQGPVVGDFDADGLPDVFFLSEPGPGEDVIRYLATNAGGGRFRAETFGPFSGNDVFGVSQFGSALDLDLDGDLDVFGGGASDRLAALWQDDGSFDPAVVTTLPSGGVECTAITAIAFGDFVAGDGPDAVVYSLPAAIEETEPVVGARCVFANAGDGSFEQISAEPITAPGMAGGISGTAVDIDGDGNLDAYFDLLGIIAFGDGNGGFEEVRVPDACWQPNSGVAGAWHNPPAVLDFDRDGMWDLVTTPTTAFVMGGDADDVQAELARLNEELQAAAAAGDTDELERLAAEIEALDVDQLGGLQSVSACILRNDGNRSFDVVAAPELDGPNFADCRSTACTSFAAADVDADGFVDLVMHHQGDGMSVAFGEDGGFSATGLAQMPDVTGFAAADFNADDRIDIAVATRDSHDRIGFNNADSGGVIWVVLRDADGNPAAPGTTIEVDLSGSGDFATGNVVLTLASSLPSLIGIGDSDNVSVRARFVNQAASSAVVVDDVPSGDTIVITEPD